MGTAELREALEEALGRRTMLQSARWVKPVFLYDPLREIETYRYILGPNQLSTADYYGALIAASRRCTVNRPGRP